MPLIQQPTNLKRLTYLSILVALGIVLNFIEPPLLTMIPGAKLGLANLSTILAILMFGPSDGVVVAIFRTFLGSVLKGNLNPIPLGTSVLGGVFAAIVMALFFKFFKKQFSIDGISTLGGLSNNITQFFFVLLVTRNPAFWAYFPVLLVLGGLSGWIIGIIAKLSYNKLGRVEIR